MAHPERSTRPAVCCACAQQCGILVEREGTRVVAIHGDKAHPVSRGFICPKGRYAHELHYAPGRVHRPRKRVGPRGSGRWAEVSWDEALDDIAERTRGLIERHGPETVAMSFGTLHSAEWGLGERFMNLLGSPNSVGQDKICYGPNAVGESLTYGFGTTFFTAPTPGVTRCMVVWGMRPSASAPLLWRSIVAAQRAGATLIVVDPERTREAQAADLWLQNRPASDAALALGLLHCVIGSGRYDAEFVERHTVGFEELRQRASEYAPAKVAEATWVPEAQIRRAADLYTEHRPAIIHGGNGLCQTGPSAVQAARAIACLVAISGNLDVPGGHTLAGPPRGIVANGDAVCADALPAETRSRRLGAERYPFLGDGFAPLDDAMSAAWFGKRNTLSWITTAHEPTLWSAILEGEPYPVTALFVQAHAALGAGANAARAEAALRDSRLELLVAHDLFENPTTRLADYLLPATHWLEVPFYSAVYGYMAFAGDYVEGSAQPIPTEHEHRSDYALWRDLGRRLGQAEHWPEHAEEFWGALVAPVGLDFEALCAHRGPRFGEAAAGPDAPPRAPRFGTPSGKVELRSDLAERLGADALPEYRLAPLSEQHSEAYPLVLTTGGRLLEGFHHHAHQTERFRRKRPDPWVRLHPERAAALGVAEGEWVRIETPVGSVVQEVHLSDALHPDVVQAERWWYPERAEDEDDPFGFRAAHINLCTDDAPESCDPILGSWLLRGVPCRIRPVP